MNAEPKTTKGAFYGPNSWSLHTHGSDEGDRWVSGTVLTEHGGVSVHSEKTFTSMRAMFDGEVFDRVWRRGFKKRYLVTLADRFTADIYEGNAL